MIAILCLDQKNGLYFNERRQSKDRYVIRDIVRNVGDKTLHINKYSEELFEKTNINLKISDDYFDGAKKGDFCFIENQIVDLKDTEKIVVYRWDKSYPTDYKVSLNRFKLISTLEFQGYSHDKIVKEVYEKNGEI